MTNTNMQTKKKRILTIKFTAIAICKNVHQDLKDKTVWEKTSDNSVFHTGIHVINPCWIFVFLGSDVGS